MTTTTETQKRCIGYKRGGIPPHYLIASLGNFYKDSHSKDGLQSRCKECMKAVDIDRRAPSGSTHGTPRAEEGTGAYLAVEKLRKGAGYIGKFGETGQGFRSRAGILAAHAREAHGLDVEHAEILHVIDFANVEDRKDFEKQMMEKVRITYGSDYFDIRDYKVLEDLFIEYGRRPNGEQKRDTYDARDAEFETWRAA